jgi:prepilin-type N-terminal cleavage/methylation domain-containing protein
MKPRFANQRTTAMTLVEVLLVIVVLGILAVVIVLDKPHRNYFRINCVNNLHQIDLAFKRLVLTHIFFI